MTLTFLHLNVEWNAEPNAPAPHINIEGGDVLLTFYVNPFRFRQFQEEERGVLRFVNCSRYRLGPPTHRECRLLRNQKFSAPHVGTQEKPTILSL